MSPSPGNSPPASSHSAAAAYKSPWRQANPADEPMRLVDALDFQMVRVAQCGGPLLREIVDFLETQNTSHPFQFPQWAGPQAYAALLRRRGKLRWVASCSVFYPAGRILRAIRALILNRGPVCDDPDLAGAGLRHLVEVGRRRGFIYIDIDPEWTGDFAESAAEMLARNGWELLSAGRSSLRLDLSPDFDQLLGHFRKVTRYEIRRSERQEVEVRMARDESECDEWLRLFVEMAKEKHFAAGDCGQIRGVLRWLLREADRGGLLLARKDGRLLGGIVMVRSGLRCWYLFGATSKDSKFNAGHLLQWRAIQWAKRQGCREYDFTGGESHEGADSGTAFFKQGFCDDLVHFPPAQRRILSANRIKLSNLVSKLRTGLRID